MEWIDRRRADAVDEPQPLVGVLSAVCVGIVVDRYSPIPLVAWCGLGLLAAVTWRLRTDRWRMVALLAAIVCVGGAWHHRAWYLFAANDIGGYASERPEPITIEAIVTGGPRAMPSPNKSPLRPVDVGLRTRMEIRATAFENKGATTPLAGNAIVVVTGQVLGIEVGDRVRVDGQLVAPPSASNPGDFDYADYCRGNRVLAMLRVPTPQAVEVLQGGSRWWPPRWIDRLQTIGAEQLHDAIAPNNAGLAAAMFLGLREELDHEQHAAFIETGAVHLLVISGLNVGILAYVLLGLQRVGLVDERTMLWLLIALVTLYTVVTGAQPPVVRAGVLVTIVCVGRLLHRAAPPLNSLAAAALVVLALNPVDLFRVGTQLSFLAVAALIAVGQWRASHHALEQLMAWMGTGPREVASLGNRAAGVMLRLFVESLAISVAVWIVVQPLVAARFHLVSPAALLLGPLLALPVTVAMAFGFVVMAFTWLVPPLGNLAGIICDRALTLLTSTVAAARDTPGARYWTAGPPDWWLAGYYLLLAFACLAPRRYRGEWRVPIIFAAWCLLGIGESLVTPWLLQPTHDRLTFLAVNHGLATVVETASGKTIVYDAGCMGSPEIATDAVANYLWSRRRGTIKTLVISHADLDHFSGVLGLLERFQVNEIVVGPTMFVHDDPALDALRRAIEQHRVPLRIVAAGDALEENITLLHPPLRGVLASDNANSIVLRLETPNGGALLTGDLEGPGLAQLITQLQSPTPTGKTPIDVLLAPHHGSPRSDPPGLAQAAQPAHVVISGGYRDGGAPSQAAYRAVGARVWHTAADGAIFVDFAAKPPQIRSFRVRPVTSVTQP